MAQENISVVLAERPKGEIIPGQTFALKKSPAPTAAELKDGQILVEILYLSVDPAMRGWLNDVRSYIPPVQIGEMMRSFGSGRVLASRSSKAAVGDIVYANSGWQQYAILDEDKFDPQSDFPNLQEPQDVLSALGLTGVTAWWGMIKIGDPKPGETVVVSGAAGATGSVAGQIAKLKGARVVGIAGSDDKCKWLVEDLGFDVALNYKAPDFKQKFKEATPNFIDVYFDNVGGEILELALSQAAKFSRFIACGQISQYNSSSPVGPRNISAVVSMRIRFQGFIIFDHPESFPIARKELSDWIAEGKLKKNETIVKGGIEVVDKALADLYKGINTGKLLVLIKDPKETPSKL